MSDARVRRRARQAMAGVACRHDAVDDLIGEATTMRDFFDASKTTNERVPSSKGGVDHLKNPRRRSAAKNEPRIQKRELGADRACRDRSAAGDLNRGGAATSLGFLRWVNTHLRTTESQPGAQPVCACGLLGSLNHGSKGC